MAPIAWSARKPPMVWGTVAVEGDSLVVRLAGWRALWAAKRTLRVPLQAVIDVRHDPGAYVNIEWRLRHVRRARSTIFKLGAQPGVAGWSFWACGLARNAVVFETEGIRYRYIIVEVAEPDAVVASVRRAAGIAPKTSARSTVRPIGQPAARPKAPPTVRPMEGPRAEPPAPPAMRRMRPMADPKADPKERDQT